MVVAVSSARDEGPLESPNRPSDSRVMTPPAIDAGPSASMSRSPSLGGRAGKRAMTAGEEWLAGPGRCKMKPETPDTPHDASRDFEQVQTDGADRRRRQSRAREDRAPEVREQQQREAVQLQPEGVRTKAMTTEAIRVDVELELLVQFSDVPRSSYQSMRSAARPRRLVTMKRTLRPAAVTSILTRMRRGWGHVFARCRKLVRMCRGCPRRSYRACAFATTGATRALKTRFVPMPST
jgi:hypothetical protein